MTGSPLLKHYREPEGTKEMGEVEELMQNGKYMQSLHQEDTVFIQHLTESFNTPHSPCCDSTKKKKKTSATV